MIAENNRSIFQCHCGKFLGQVYAICQGPPGEQRIIAVIGTCKQHGEVESKSPCDYEEFFPDES